MRFLLFTLLMACQPAEASGPLCDDLGTYSGTQDLVPPPDEGLVAGSILAVSWTGDDCLAQLPEATVVISDGDGAEVESLRLSPVGHSRLAIVQLSLEPGPYVLELENGTRLATTQTEEPAALLPEDPPSVIAANALYYSDERALVVHTEVRIPDEAPDDSMVVVTLEETGTVVDMRTVDLVYGGAHRVPMADLPSRICLHASLVSGDGTEGPAGPSACFEEIEEVQLQPEPPTGCVHLQPEGVYLPFLLIAGFLRRRTRRQGS